jgi:hypothetical protein
MGFSRDTLILEKLNSDAAQVCYLCFAEYSKTLGFLNKVFQTN